MNGNRFGFLLIFYHRETLIASIFSQFPMIFRGFTMKYTPATPSKFISDEHIAQGSKNTVNKPSAVSFSCPHKNDKEQNNEEVIALLMGSAYLSDGEVKILCNRKITSLNRGLSSNEIMAYLYLKLHSQGGIVRSLSHAEICDNLDISPRDVYHVLGTLNKVGLLGIEGKPGMHYRNIRIRHYSEKTPSRFLSLNRTFFHQGEDDHESFKKLSAGAKSAMIYLLSREKFWKNNGKSGPKTYGNSIEVSTQDIVKALGVQRDTVILYIRELNDAFHDFFNIVHALTGTLNDRRLALIQDRRIKYGGVTSNAARRWLSTIDNKALGFWRLFDQWLTCHGYRKELVPVSTVPFTEHGDIFITLADDPAQRLNQIRSVTFTNIIRLLQEGVKASKIYKDVVNYISQAGGLSAPLPFYLYAGLSPQYTDRGL